jgi:hypothetical protein
MTHNPASIVGLLYDARQGSATASERTSGRAADLRFSGEASEICPAANREDQTGRVAIVGSRKTQWLFPIAVTLHNSEEVAMLGNVLLPHVPASLVFREYTPGVVTAVLIKLPIMGILICQAIREQGVSGTKAIAYALLGSAHNRRGDFAAVRTSLKYFVPALAFSGTHRGGAALPASIAGPEI